MLRIGPVAIEGTWPTEPPRCPQLSEGDSLGAVVRASAVGVKADSASSDPVNSDVARLANSIQRGNHGGDNYERAASSPEGYVVSPQRINQTARPQMPRIERVGRIRQGQHSRALLANELRTGGWYREPSANGTEP